MSDSLSLHETLNIALANNPQVVALSETHASNAMKNYPQIIEYIKSKDSHFDCLLTEFPNNTTLDHLAISQKRGDLVKDRRILEFSDTIKKANALNLKIIPADPAQRTLDSETAWDLSYEGVEVRSEEMAAKIARLLKAGVCRKILFIVGKSHMASVEKGQATVKSELLNTGIKLDSINIVGTDFLSYGNFVDGSFYWRSCNQNPLPPMKISGFKNDASIAKLPLFETGGVWGDFDQTLVFPPGRFESKYPKLLPGGSIAK